MRSKRDLELPEEALISFFPQMGIFGFSIRDILWNSENRIRQFKRVTSQRHMEIKEFPLTCHQISAISIKKESSDYVVLPSHLKPKRSNILGYYIFRITSDISDRWVYCRVIDWIKEEHDCYLPTVREWDCFNRIVDDELPGDSEQL